MQDRVTREDLASGIKVMTEMLKSKDYQTRGLRLVMQALSEVMTEVEKERVVINRLVEVAKQSLKEANASDASLQ